MMRCIIRRADVAPGVAISALRDAITNRPARSTRRAVKVAVEQRRVTLATVAGLIARSRHRLAVDEHAGAAADHHAAAAGNLDAGSGVIGSSVNADRLDCASGRRGRNKQQKREDVTHGYFLKNRPIACLGKSRKTVRNTADFDSQKLHLRHHEMA